MRPSQRNGDQPPSLPLIAVSAPARGWVKGESWFLRWLLIECLPAAGAQAILPSIPTLELFSQRRHVAGPAYGLPFGALRWWAFRGPL